MQQIDTNTLRSWLEAGKDVSILDIRPIHERTEWFIPGSIHFDTYEKLKENSPDALHGLHLDKAVPVVTVCAGGKTSLIAAELLQQQGFEAYSLEGGMKEWSLSWNSAVIEMTGYKIIQLRRTGKGCLSYIILSDKEAIVIDASLPVEVYKKFLKEEQSNLVAVLETHIHADHLSRSKHLADELNAKLFLPAPNRVLFHHKPLHPDQSISFGKVSLKAISTPGHTIESVSFLLNNEVLFTGDILFTNSVGRPDLKADDEEAKRRAALLYDSLQMLVRMKDFIIVLPAHTDTPSDFDHKPVMATLKDIKSRVNLLHLAKPEFVKTILAKLPPTPANFLAIAEKNLKGDFSDINPVDLEAGANRCAVS